MSFSLQIALGILLGVYVIAFIAVRLHKSPRAEGKNRTTPAPWRKLLSKALRAMQVLGIVVLMLGAMALAAAIVRIVVSAVSSMPPLSQ
jgi:hypothetical protein